MSTPQITPNLGLTVPPIGSTDYGSELSQDLMIIDTAIGNLQSGLTPVVFSSTAIYSRAQVVSYTDGSGNGAIYISLVANNVGNTPVFSGNTVYWAKFAQNGATGATGPQGTVSLPEITVTRNAVLSKNTNFFDDSLAQAGNAINSTTGTVFALSGAWATGRMAANAGGMMVLSLAVPTPATGAIAPGSSTANQFGPVSAVLGATVLHHDGSTSANDASYAVSPWVFIGGASQFTTNAVIFGGAGGTDYGLVYGDATQTVIGFDSNFSVPSPQTVPSMTYTVAVSGAQYVRFTFSTNGGGSNYPNLQQTPSAIMVVTGPTLPSSYVGYAPNTPGSNHSGIAFYTGLGSYISGIDGPQAAGTPFSVPAAAATVAATVSANPVGTLMVVNGTTLPSSYVGFGTLAPNQIAAAISAAATSGAVAMTALWPAMQGLTCWLPMQDGAGTAPVDASGHSKNGSIAGGGTAAAWAGPVGLIPNGQTVTIANANGRPVQGLVAYFPAATPNGSTNYQFMGGVAAGGMNSFQLKTSYGVGLDHSNYAMFAVVGYSNGYPTAYAAGGLTGVHAIELVIGDGGSILDRIFIDGMEADYLGTPASSGSNLLGGAQFTNSVQLAANVNGTLTPVIYSYWSADVRDTPAQAKARTASELRRVASLGVKVGYGPTSEATDSILSITGTSIDFGYTASQAPSALLALNFPCTIWNFAVTGQPPKDMAYGFEDREATVFHHAAARNIAYHGGVTNGVVNLQQSPANAVADILLWCRKARALGYKVIVSTMISRTVPAGGGQSYNSQTGDALAQASNALLLAVGDEADWVCHPAADAILGATGASASATNFTDGVHPNNTGQLHLVAPMKASVQGVYGSPQTIVSGNYSHLDQDRVIVQTSSSASTLTLKNAIYMSYNSAGKLTISNSGTGTMTIAPVASQTINGAATYTLSPGATVRLMPFIANSAAGGPVWITL